MKNSIIPALLRLIIVLSLVTCSATAVEGWFYHASYPYVWSVEDSSWLMVQEADSGLHLYDASTGSYTDPSAVESGRCSSNE